MTWGTGLPSTMLEPVGSPGTDNETAKTRSPLLVGGMIVGMIVGAVMYFAGS